METSTRRDGSGKFLRKRSTLVGGTYPFTVDGLQHASDWYSRHCFTPASKTSGLDTSCGGECEGRRGDEGDVGGAGGGRRRWEEKDVFF